MSKMKEAIQKIIASNKKVIVYIPAQGYKLVKIKSITDDIVTLKLNSGDKLKLHYTAVIVKIDKLI